MTELVVTALAAPVEPATFVRMLGLPAGRTLAGRSAELARSVREWYAAHGRPRARARHVESVEVHGETVRAGDEPMVSPGLARRLHERAATGLVAVAATAGPEVDAEADRLWRAGRPDESVFLAAYGAAVADALVRDVRSNVVRAVAPTGLHVLDIERPGCCGWDIREMPPLLRLLEAPPRSTTHETIARVPVVRLTEGGALTPMRSLVVVLPVSARAPRPDAVPCRGCAVSLCAHRREEGGD